MPGTQRKIHIGRDASSDLVLSDRSVSRKHAELLIDSSGAMELLDLDSSSGTFLIRAGKEDEISRAKLKPGDVIRFGEVELSLADLQARVEKLTPKEASARKAPPPLPPLPKKSPPPADTPAPVATGPVPGGRMVRCECGTIKKKNSPCPSCGT